MAVRNGLKLGDKVLYAPNTKELIVGEVIYLEGDIALLGNFDLDRGKTLEVPVEHLTRVEFVPVGVYRRVRESEV